MENFKVDSRVGIDLVSLARVLPSKKLIPETGRASWLGKNDKSKHDVNSQISSITDTINNNNNINSNNNNNNIDFPILVIGGEKDFIVDIQGVHETATFLGVEPHILKDIPHDLMLCSQWKIPANFIAEWLNRFK